MNSLPRIDAPVSRVAQPPKIYYVHPLQLNGLDAWQEAFRHAAGLGFDTVLSAPLFKRGGNTSIFVSQDIDRIDPRLGLGEDLGEVLKSLTGAANRLDIRLMLDLVVDKVAKQDSGSGQIVSDPRISPDQSCSDTLDLSPSDETYRHLEAWRSRIATMAQAGVAGFRCLGLERVPAEAWASLIRHGHSSANEVQFIAWTPGIQFERRRALAQAGFDGCFSSLAWWNMEDSWLAEEHLIQRELGYQIAFPEAPFAKRLAHGTESVEVLERRALRSLKLSAYLGGGLMIPMGFEYGASTPLDQMCGDGLGLAGFRDRSAFDISGEIRAVNAMLGKSVGDFERRPFTLISASNTSAVAILQSDREDLRTSDKVRAIIVNRDLRRSAAPPLNAIQQVASSFLPLMEKEGSTGPRLMPGEIRILEGQASKPIQSASPLPDLTLAAAAPRLAIEKIAPSVDEGRFSVKRVVGERVRVEADIFGDGHDPLAAALIWRAADEEDWQEVRMQLFENDRWYAEFTPRRMGRHEYVVEAWKNLFAIFRYEFGKKHDARLDLRLEIQEGANLLQAAVDSSSGELKAAIGRILDDLRNAPEHRQIELLLDLHTSELMAKADRRPFRVRSQVIPLEAERLGASFASWYELFPRSQSGDTNRHGTFDDVIRRLPAIREMGFDVVYFPPIHPIGSTNRKGRNNSLKAAPGDPGSPYAIGSEAGGHEAIHPELGTFEDFRRLVAAAQEQGMEIALDLAIQASPDHPWLKQHPGWFDWRPDGTIRYAENPPKKYEDIVNVDFYAKDAIPSLWQELRDIVQMWVDQGVKLFRVDNPHTKPFPFWEWLIADIRSRQPEVIFLSEAFTKPKVMYRLAKIGFSQSYTYFTWRNAKWELEQYMREITTEAPKDFFRPHFFVNTHDINPDFLQNAPRPAYVIRAALAATLSGLWGVYNGFELCEGRPDAKRKEYADSEKYEIRAWDWDRPGNIKHEIGLLNRIRKENPALHSHLGLTLLTAWNDNVMFFEKASPGRENVLLIAISLDPHNTQEADVEIPLWSWNLPDNASLPMEDLISGHKFTWTGKWQRLRLEPGMPFGIWRVR
ncbi:MAG TPA: maltotransferase domain-containing protein [Pseudorhizobium sp.]|nr:maltotransferase domain-containing protein [Pseudorhizobium sp.]